MNKKHKIIILPEYEEKNLGLPYSIFIKNSVKAMVDIKTDNIISTQIPNFDGFVAYFIMLRILVANKFSHEEVRFFRKALNLNGKGFASLMQVTPETVSRWETGSHINEKDERLLRVLLGSSFSNKVPQMKFDPMRILQIGLKNKFDVEYQPSFCFEQIQVVEDSEDEWRGRQLAA